MATLIKLPSVAADADGGTLHQWLKQEGDAIAVGDALAEIETEKAIVEINAEQAGVLGRIVVPAGTASVPINTVIGVLLAPDEGAAAIEQALAQGGVTGSPAAGGAGMPAQAAPAGKAGAPGNAAASPAAAAASPASSAGHPSATASTGAAPAGTSRAAQALSLIHI